MGGWGGGGVFSLQFKDAVHYCGEIKAASHHIHNQEQKESKCMDPCLLAALSTRPSFLQLCAQLRVQPRDRATYEEMGPPMSANSPDDPPQTSLI